MNRSGREPRTGALEIHQPKETHKGVIHLALTFGTLLSSQRADAQRLDPLGLRLWRLVPLYAVFGVLHPGGAPPRPSRARPARRRPYTTPGVRAQPPGEAVPSHPAPSRGP